MLQKNSLSVVVPVFNEQESIIETVKRLQALTTRIAEKVVLEVIIVDDGSTDNSLRIMKNMVEEDQYNIKVLVLSKNFGHQIAITAGIDYAKSDFVAVIDADLQDPPELIEDMYDLAMTGFDVVYGKRRSRDGDSFFKKTTALAFYKVMNYMCDMDIPQDTGDFRLMSRRVVDALSRLREKHRFVRGMVPWVGFKSTALEYDRDERYAGITKYSLHKMISFATNAILSFSNKPLSLAIKLGFATIFIGSLLGCYMLYLKIFTEIPVPGITAIILTIVLFSGVQIFLIGIIGEYIARIFEEVKDRPLYIISEEISPAKEK